VHTVSQQESLISQVLWFKGLAEIYVPFVGSTDASVSRAARVGRIDEWHKLKAQPFIWL
jgi:hypothetical protein